MKHRTVECSPSFRRRWLSGECAPYFEQELLSVINSSQHWQPKPRSKLFSGAGHVKKFVRVQVYELAQQLLDRHKFLVRQYPQDLLEQHDLGEPKDRILILPGGEPSHEAQLVRQLFADSEIVAFDIDDRAVQAAAPFVDLAVTYPVGDLRFKGAYESPRCLTARYKFANLDFCGLVTSEGVSEAVERARRMAPLVATWFSFGHEQNLPEILKCAERVGARSERHLSSLPPKVRARFLYVWARINLSDPWGRGTGLRTDTPRALKVWTYTDQRMPMICILWATAGAFTVAEPYDAVLAYEKVSIAEDAFRARVLDVARSHGRAFASVRFGVRPAVLAAWKAVATRSAGRAVQRA